MGQESIAHEWKPTLCMGAALVAITPSLQHNLMAVVLGMAVCDAGMLAAMYAAISDWYETLCGA